MQALFIKKICKKAWIHKTKLRKRKLDNLHKKTQRLNNM